MRSSKTKAILGIILAASMLAGCGAAAEEAANTTEVLVETMKAETGSLSLSSGFVGTIQAAESVNIIPMVVGTVEETFAEVGDMVEAGDVLFKIDDEAAQIQKEQAELNLKSVQQNASITQTTTEINNYSQAYNLQASVDTAKIGYEGILRNLDNAKDSVEEMEALLKGANAMLSGFDAQMAIYNADPTDATAAAALVGYASLVGVNPGTPGSYDFSKVRPAIMSQVSAAQSGLTQAENGVDALKDSERQTSIALGQARQAVQTFCELKAATGGQVLADQLQTGIDLASLGVESADLALSFYEVTTPISGKIISKNISANDIASQQMVAYVVAQDDAMTVDFNVSEDVKNTLFPGKEVVVERNGKEFKGTISEVANSVDAMTGLFKVTANVEANGEMLPNGVNVKINCETYAENNVIVIPYDAVYYDSEGSYVYLNKGGKAVKTFVTCGIFDDENIAILDGISSGDEVVVTWAANLSDGCDLKVADGSNDEVTDAN